MSVWKNLASKTATWRYQTKESHPSEREPAGFWIRAWSVVLDSLIFWSLIGLALLPISLVWDINVVSIAVTLAGVKDHDEYNPIYLLINMAAIVPVIWMWSRFQATPGKMLTGTRLIDYKTGLKPTKGKLVLRSAFYAVSGLVLFLGFIWIGFHPEKRGWHDLVAGTQVVKV
jgi:uncharacterized RDD family membrane protein YckC